MDLFKKYLLNTIAAFDPPDRPGRARVVDALQDDNAPAVEDEPLEDDLEDDQTDDPENDQTDDPEDDPVDDPEPEPAPRRRSGRPASREERRIEALAADKRALQAEINASNARLAALEARLAQPQQRQESPEEEAARLALMSPEERLTYTFDKRLRTSQEQTLRTVNTIQDQTDATAFRAILRDKPQYQRFAADVEREVARLRSLGTPMPREGVLMFIIGQNALKAETPTRTREQSNRRVRAQETRPAASARSDVRSDRRQAANTTGSAVARRLENVPI